MSKAEWTCQTTLVVYVASRDVTGGSSNLALNKYTLSEIAESTQYKKEHMFKEIPKVFIKFLRTNSVTHITPITKSIH